VVIALKTSIEKGSWCPPRHHEINLEGNPKTEQERQRDNIRKIQREPGQNLISSVTTPASGNGPNVNSTSVTLRSTMKRSALIGLAHGVGVDRPHRLGKPGKGRIGPREPFRRPRPPD
jgi:hypothetical protein